MGKKKGDGGDTPPPSDTASKCTVHRLPSTGNDGTVFFKITTAGREAAECKSRSTSPVQVEVHTHGDAAEACAQAHEWEGRSDEGEHFLEARAPLWPEEPVLEEEGATSGSSLP